VIGKVPGGRSEVVGWATVTAMASLTPRRARDCCPASRGGSAGPGVSAGLPALPALSNSLFHRRTAGYSWAMTLEKFREKWREVPGGDDASPRHFTEQLAALPDAELLAFWNDMADKRSASPLGFLQPLYRDFFRGRHTLDVGSGLGLDGMRFAAMGARWTFADIAPSNLVLLKRIASLKGLSGRVDFHLIGDDLSFDAVPPVDAVIAIGSLHHVPFDMARAECAAILTRLKRPGRWLELVYPKTRWEKEGRPTFDRWGAMTDGERTPWSEWYDVTKLRKRLAPETLRTVLDFDFQGSDFHWFDFEVF
jgi:hypothetical protein